MSEKERETTVAALPRRTAPAPIHVLARMGMPDAVEPRALNTAGEPMAKGRKRQVFVLPSRLPKAS